MSSTRSQSWLLDRRHVLRGIGVSLALPLLDCMTPLASAAGASPRVKRSAFMYLPNGVNTLDYQITTAGKDYEFSKSLAPLARHRDHITPFSGLHHPHGVGKHHSGIEIWLTGAKIGPAERNTISADQLMAQSTSPHTRFSSIELSAERGGLAVNVDGIHLPAQKNPSVVFRELFEESPGGATEQRRGYERQASILDAVLEEARSVGGKLGQADRGRLDQYLTSVREVEIRTQRANVWLDTPRPTIDSADKSKLDRNVSVEQFGEYLRTMYDIMVLAFQTDQTRVATFCTGYENGGPAIPEIGIQARHGLSHHNGNERMMRDLTASDTFNIQQFAYFLDRLAEVQDADGPLLDSTMCLYGSGMAYGHGHGNANLPILFAGGKALCIRHGQHVDYNALGKPEGYAYDLENAGKHYAICNQPVNSNARLSNLLLTMVQKMDVPAEKFGDSTSDITEIG
ncbi:DUF1552 domain-containing protein [Lignipirellula cremea]|uniref:DUF1552 domain-containing protein n=1 Tax=Lignipirellula cremea TaxID=2528010 RepID=A0A518DXN8_9BACT|nr:DUF1552 domain-containing protein [Lignipirellula cremea]QDU96607.1 hypothetical protein Pla8534_44280 [Lignipirellula cremea]